MRQMNILCTYKFKWDRGDYCMKFNDYFLEIPRLETKRFVLRAFARGDMDQYFDILRDENVQKYLGGGVPIFDTEPHVSN